MSLAFPVDVLGPGGGGVWRGFYYGLQFTIIDKLTNVFFVLSELGGCICFLACKRNNIFLS
jgi:hypothetical protein